MNAKDARNARRRKLDAKRREHKQQLEMARMSTTARGYGHVHPAVRKRYAQLVRSGQAMCARCGELIGQNAPWDLDHTDDRTGYLGPSHARCNRANTRRGYDDEIKPPRITSRVW